jgi:tellurite resistance protein TerC
MIAGAPLTYWIGFHLLVGALLFIDMVVLGRRSPALGFRGALLWTLFLAALALAFGGFVFSTQGLQPSLAFLSGYVIEASLSIDNLFVFILLFRSFGLNAAAQHRALRWGILGAILLRAFFIVVGIALLKRFAAVEYIFGGLLLFAAFRLFRQQEGKAEVPVMVRWMGGNRSTFFMAIVAVEITDLIFAIDSIPAVLAITHETFLVYTSNIFAILGLRSLYFVLAGLLDRLHLLHYGLALVLAFVGGKMLLAHWVEIPVVISLAVILVTIGSFAVASMRRAPALSGSSRSS